MASSTQSSSEEQFLCSICLEVFSEPVSTPCGHNFCKRCISQTWDSSESCFCPLCKEVFSIRLQLKTNTLLSEMVSQAKLKKRRRSMDEQPFFSEVQCDVCSEPKLKAVKSCLVCLSSFCESHLQPHLSAPRLKRHQLMEPVDLEDLEDRMCPTHQRPLELFCESHLQPHLTVSGLKRHQLMEPVDDLEDRMCPTHDRPQELYCSTDQKAITMAIKTILIIILICVVCSVLEHKNNTSVPLKEALSELKTSLSLKFNKVFRELASASKKKELRRVQTFAVDVTLDPDSAHPRLVLSEDLKQVHDTDVWKQLPDSPQRFDYHPIVLGKQSFSSGRFYFEVQVKGKTKWTLGVARESVNRKRELSASPEDGFWTIMLRDGEYKALDSPSVPLSPQRPPQKVGVFVDYGAGLVSFFDVDSADLLYSFTGCSFREKLFPFFCPEPNEGGTNSAPLIISAVSSDRHRNLSDHCVQTDDVFWVTTAIVLSLILLLCALSLLCLYFFYFKYEIVKLR